MHTPTPPITDSSTSSPKPRRWVRVVREIAVTVALVALVMQVAGWLRAPALPETAPDFALSDLDGQLVELSQLRGQTVVLNFWATWCGPCRIEAPAFSRFSHRNPDIVVLGIAADGTVGQLRKAERDLGIDYTILRGDRETLQAYGIGTYPTTVVVGPKGEVLAAYTGMLLDPQLAWLTMGS